MGALMAPTNENGPEVTTPQGRPEDASLATKTSTEDRVSRRRRSPMAYASLFAPHPGRARWLITYVCPHCKHGHRALAATEALARVRRPLCPVYGRRVRVRVARTYRGSAGAPL
jgi:hypothetical protein